VQYGILGDIHANLQALNAVLRAMEEDGVERHLCLGDLVGYGADPGPCITLVRELDPILVGGNHDWAAAGRLSLGWFNVPAQEAILWTRQVLPREDLDWLGSLELVTRHGDVTLAHSTLHEPEAFDYLFTPGDARRSFDCLETRLAFVGHSHVPVTFFDSEPVTYSTGTEVRYDGRRAISNVGSVGQPRDEDPRAAYGVYDDATGLLRIRRVAYDAKAAADRILQVGLPSILGDRLLVGR
jgi:diadenosine tetraphosphatase ApaH/serine/threonine PP2A family protein phosphatase